jgi:ABC-2 type transport system ATP-binding protein
MSGGHDLAVELHNVWKQFRVYQHRTKTLKDKILSGKSHYETMWALQDISLELPVGVSLGIVGPNGCGKSTLLRVISRVLTPEQGTVVVNGSLAAILELGIGFHPDLTGRENVFLSGVLMGLHRSDIRARYDDIVEFAGLGPFMDTPLKTYSTGMWARLAFSLATCVDPDILIVDEVLAVGDMEFQMRCQERLMRYVSEGRTIIIVSHSIALVQSLCQIAIWLDKGVMYGAGDVMTVTELYGTFVHGAGVTPLPVPPEDGLTFHDAHVD